MQVFYLHGFASSPDSSKATYFRDRLAAHGVGWHCPDLNAPDFSTLTATRMIEQTEQALATLPPGPVVLIGSSIGGFVAWHVAARAEAARRRRVDRLVLLAPAFDFGRSDMHDLGPSGLEAWRSTGWHEFFHYAEDRPRRVHYELFVDAQRYDSLSQQVEAPTFIVQGLRDEVVDPAMVERFAAGRPHVSLLLVDDDHQLRETLDSTWIPIAEFLGLNPHPTP